MEVVVCVGSMRQLFLLAISNGVPERLRFVAQLSPRSVASLVAARALHTLQRCIFPDSGRAHEATHRNQKMRKRGRKMWPEEQRCVGQEVQTFCPPAFPVAILARAHFGSGHKAHHTQLRHKSDGVQFSPFGCPSRGGLEFVLQV